MRGMLKGISGGRKPQPSVHDESAHCTLAENCRIIELPSTSGCFSSDHYLPSDSKTHPQTGQHVREMFHQGLLKVEPVFQLKGELARVGEVRTSKCVAVIEHVSAVAQVQPAQAQTPAFSEGLAKRTIDRGMRGQMRGTITVQKSRAIVDIESDPGPARKIKIHSRAQCVPLIMI